MKIVQTPDSVLFIPTAEVEVFDSNLTSLAMKMLRIMKDNKGVGLAANQVGIPLRLAVIDVGQGPLVLVNPRIIESSGSRIHTEACLSVENRISLGDLTLRPAEVKVEYQDLSGNKKTISAKDNLLSQALQHEIDHLDGCLYTSKMVVVGN